MSDAPKYIIAEWGWTPTAFVFPCWIPHSEFANSMGIKKEDLLGAGFVRFEIIDSKIHASTYGKSTSLDKVSDASDASIIEKQYRLRE